MPRFLAVLLTLIIIVLIAFYMGWLGYSTHSDNDHKVGVEVTVNKDRIREDTQKADAKAREMGREARDDLRNLAGKVEKGLSSDNSVPFKLEMTHVDLVPGEKTGIRVTRGGDLKPMQLTLTATPYLVASGGDFKQDQTESTITIEARADAKDGTVTVEGGGKTEVLTVSVKNKVL